jgi:hypothetical protein
VSAREAKPKARRSAVGVLLVGVLVAACGGNAPRATPTPTAPASSSMSVASASATTASAPPAPSAGATSAAGTTTGSSSAVASPVGLAAGQVGTRAQVPWDQVGPGWFLVQSDSAAYSQPVSTAPAPTGGSAILSLVSPDGARYVITTWPGLGAGSAPMNLAGLAAWSGDGRHALLSEGQGIAIEMDLTTGARHQISVPQLSTIGFTSPTGANLVAVQNIVAPDGSWTGQRLVRLDLNGRPQVQLAQVDRVSMRWLYSPDGAAVYLNGPGGLRVVSNAGGPIRELPTVETADADCGPVAWWDQNTILTSCTENSGSRLWLARVAGGSATPLTPLPGTEPVVDLGYDNAVRAGDAVFAQHLEACGVVTVHRLAANGVGTRIAIPQSLSSDRLIGAVGSKIAIVSSTACSYPAWFGFYDPTTNATQKIVPDVPGELGVLAALAFP